MKFLAKKQKRSKNNVVAKDLVTSGLYRSKTFVDRKKRDRDADRRSEYETE